MVAQRLNPRTVAHDDGTITVDGVAVAEWRHVAPDEMPHVRRQVGDWVTSLQAIAGGGVGRDERLRRERRAMELLPLVADLVPDAPEEPHVDLAIAKDIVAYWHFAATGAAEAADAGEGRRKSPPVR